MRQMNANDIIVLAGAIATIGSAITVICRWIAPAVKLSNRVTDMEKRQQKDYQALTDVKEMNSILCRGMMSLIDHQLTGNSIDKLRKSKDEIQTYLTNR